jgi:hypothetical protein
MGEALNVITGLVAGNQGKQQQLGAAGRQSAMGEGLWATPLPGYAKKAKTGLWDLLTPEIQAVLGGNTQVINPELTSGMYNFLTRDLTKNYQDTRKGTEQGLVNRGMDYGNVMSKTLGKLDTDYKTTLGDIGTKVAYNAATTNAEAQRGRMNTLLQLLSGLFGQGKAEQLGFKNTGLGLMTDASSARAVAGSDYWADIAKMVADATARGEQMLLAGA